MPARKAGKKGGAKKSGAKKGGAAPQGGRARLGSKALTQNLVRSIIDRRQWVMYAQPIWSVIASGDVAEMRRAAEVTRTHLADVKQSLARLEEAVRSGKR